MLYALEESLKFLLLPGMDGTGFLFEPFVRLAPENYEIEVISLIQKPNISYTEQAIKIAKKITSPTTIIAESYSGVIATEILKLAPNNIFKVVFVASFLECPSTLAKYGKLAPQWFLNKASNFSPLSSKLLFGKWKNQELNALFTKAMKSVDAQTMKYRLTQIANLDGVIDKFDCQCLYLKASHDNLVSGHSVVAFESAFTQLEVRIVEGTHFLLQTNPKDCWRNIESAGI